MADVATFTSWSSTSANNNPTGSTVIGAGLDDNLREIQAQTASWRDGTGYGILTVTSVSGSNTITGTTSPAPTLAANQKFLLMPAGTNTGAVTLNLNSGGAKNVYAGNSALVGGELHANIPVVLEYDGTQFQTIGPVFKQPTRTVLTSGSGATYTTPTGCTRIDVVVIGGGGGGAGATANNGTAGNASSFGTLTANGGGAGIANGGAGGAGGTASGGDINISGGGGQGGVGNNSVFNPPGGVGGSSRLGGAGSSAPAAAGGNAATNSGSGGGGGGSGSANSGGGGGAGGYTKKLFVGPAATYTYTVGASANGGAAGANAGGTGAAGIITVDEFYN